MTKRDEPKRGRDIERQPERERDMERDEGEETVEVSV